MNASILRTLHRLIDQQNIQNISIEKTLKLKNKLLFVKENDASLWWQMIITNCHLSATFWHFLKDFKQKQKKIPFEVFKTVNDWKINIKLSLEKLSCNISWLLSMSCYFTNQI